jgi:hypothetical protein
MMMMEISRRKPSGAMKANSTMDWPRSLRVRRPRCGRRALPAPDPEVDGIGVMSILESIGIPNSPPG